MPQRGKATKNIYTLETSSLRDLLTRRYPCQNPPISSDALDKALVKNIVIEETEPEPDRPVKKDKKIRYVCESESESEEEVQYIDDTT